MGLSTDFVISIHTPREGSDLPDAARMSTSIISIHTPREGSDFTLADDKKILKSFQSTLPARGATPNLRGP